ncbi:hypothetical protein ABENE_06305 [Asticcacaulis benevestitus DSM 16100 = ATCC BAA-896]|uniref:Uncharacterized protein n=1 Tax=Asticcacaulis benevestitus DSM 16100 = ATCC BAA-896 TaxID=1121022 RepID=V4PGW1_9CAUL|nr:hypothetical protein ABENE_06305 [Asticcacaulis benevestitus DSM 16100 = ATCC BAA-896]
MVMQPAKATPMNGRTISFRINFFITLLLEPERRLSGHAPDVNGKGAVLSAPFYQDKTS